MRHVKLIATPVFVIPGEDPGSINRRCPLHMPAGCNGSRIESGMTILEVPDDPQTSN